MVKYRFGDYAIYNGIEFFLRKRDDGWKLLSKNDFTHYGFQPCGIGSWGLYTTPDQVESAYRLETWARYKGYDFFVRGYDKENDTYGLSIPWEMGNEVVLHLFGIIRRSGHDDDTPFFKADAFEDIWELRTPVEGFCFVGPEKVYLKKDGVWLIEVL